MKLYIDTSNSEYVTIGLNKELTKEPARKEKAQRLLNVIDEELKKRNLTLKNINEVEVKTGPGSFTGLKVGVSVANSLGWTLNIPVNGKNIKKDGPIEPTY